MVLWSPRCPLAPARQQRNAGIQRMPYKEVVANSEDPLNNINRHLLVRDKNFVFRTKGMTSYTEGMV